MTDKKFIRTCSIWRSLEVIGDAPTLLILESFWFGARRFDEFQKRTGLLKTVVSDRLKKLVQADCLRKVAYSERPPRYEYQATEKLRDLFPVSLAMLYWERKWGALEGKLRITLRHKTCGETTSPKPVCGSCRKDINPADSDWREGPGVGMMLAKYSRRRRRTAGAESLNHSTTLFDEISSIIGDRWSTLIIRSIFTNLNKFDEIREDTQIATNVLSERLAHLCEEGILIKQPLAEQTGRHCYRLTDKGKGIYPILLFLLVWGDKWYAAPEGAPLILTHRPCGEPLFPEMACSACGETVKLGELEVEQIEPDIKRDPLKAVS